MYRERERESKRAREQERERERERERESRPLPPPSSVKHFSAPSHAYSERERERARACTPVCFSPPSLPLSPGFLLLLASSGSFAHSLSHIGLLSSRSEAQRRMHGVAYACACARDLTLSFSVALAVSRYTTGFPLSNTQN